MLKLTQLVPGEFYSQHAGGRASDGSIVMCVGPGRIYVVASDDGVFVGCWLDASQPGHQAFAEYEELGDA
jgi:hypothetical protein